MKLIPLCHSDDVNDAADIALKRQKWCAVRVLLRAEAVFRPNFEIAVTYHRYGWAQDIQRTLVFQWQQRLQHHHEQVHYDIKELARHVYTALSSPYLPHCTLCLRVIRLLQLEKRPCELYIANALRHMHAGRSTIRSVFFDLFHTFDIDLVFSEPIRVMPDTYAELLLCGAPADKVHCASVNLPTLDLLPLHAYIRGLINTPLLPELISHVASCIYGNETVDELSEPAVYRTTIQLMYEQ
ncbi:MAG: hypothetical protein MHM6MM_001772 [Cercozoa sp. M6MM]